MNLVHRRWQKLARLLASGVLEGGEGEAVRAHLDGCPVCLREYRQTRDLVAWMARDPARAAEPALPASALLRRIDRALEAEPGEVPRSRLRFWLAALPSAAAVMAVVVVLPILFDRGNGSRQAGARPHTSDAAPAEDALARMERGVAREQAARYLDQAGEVLVTVATTGVDCSRGNGRLDMGRAPERSRELLEQRRLVVDIGGEAIAGARGVLDEVEMALRDVAGLPSCVKRRDLERLLREVERRQLLMRIRLMTRELEG